MVTWVFLVLSLINLVTESSAFLLTNDPFSYCQGYCKIWSAMFLPSQNAFDFWSKTVSTLAGVRRRYSRTTCFSLCFLRELKSYCNELYMCRGSTVCGERLQSARTPWAIPCRDPQLAGHQAHAVLQVQGVCHWALCLAPLLLVIFTAWHWSHTRDLEYSKMPHQNLWCHLFFKHEARIGLAEGLGRGPPDAVSKKAWLHKL